jgi:hypothetical protein
MEHLSESLRIAAADPPPTGIDVDTLIEGEHRTARRRRWLAAVAGIAAAVTAVILGVAAVSGHGPSARATPGGDGPSKSPAVEGLPAWMPTEPAASAIPRLDAAFRHALQAAYAGVPAGDMPTFTPSLYENAQPAAGDPGSGSSPDSGGGASGASAEPNPSVSAAPIGVEPYPSATAAAGEPGSSPDGTAGTEPNPAAPTLFSGGPESGYKGLVTIADRLGYSTVMVMVQAAPAPYPTACPAADQATSCTADIAADGSTILRTTVAVPDGGELFEFDVFHPDGTHVSLIEATHDTVVGDGTVAPQPAKGLVRTFLTRPTPILTMDQLAGLAVDPGLTLFP